jgi:hypothetical protein
VKTLGLPFIQRGINWAGFLGLGTKTAVTIFGLAALALAIDLCTAQPHWVSIWIVESLARLLAWYSGAFAIIT